MEVSSLVRRVKQVEPEALEQAFESFNHLSTTLVAAYQELKRQVGRLNNELAEIRLQKQHEYEKRARTAKRLQHLLNVLPGGVIVIDGDSTVRECNSIAADLLGAPLLGQKWNDIVARAFLPKKENGRYTALRNGHYVTISTQSLEPESGQILLLMDVTKTYILQEQLSRLERISTMGDMAVAIAHQIRTPLSSALLYAANMSSADLDQDLRQQFIKKQLACLQHLESLVSNMLLLARGRQLDFKLCNLSKLIDELITVQKADPALDKVHFLVEGQCQDIMLNVNRDAFFSALQNLLNNAAQAINYQGQVHLRFCLKASGMIELNISDNGPGIPLAIQGRLFDPFFTTKERGTGLGLAVASAVIREHKGELSFKTEEHAGTTFTICLPSA